MMEEYVERAPFGKLMPQLNIITMYVLGSIKASATWSHFQVLLATPVEFDATLLTINTFSLVVKNLAFIGESGKKKIIAQDHTNEILPTSK